MNEQTEPVTRPAGLGVGLAGAVTDPGVVDRWRAKVVTIPGSTCLWWTGAISGHSNHGRFWIGSGQVVIAHRFAYALTCGAPAAAVVAVLAHRCDNPLCQRIDSGHVAPSTHGENRREWVSRRSVIGTPVADPRGTATRARVLRDLARQDPALAGAELTRLAAAGGMQESLW